MTDTDTEALAVGDDDTELELRTWGLSGQPASWALSSWVTTIEVIRQANRGAVPLSAVQAVLDGAFPGRGFLAANVALAHVPTGLFTATVTDQSVRFDLAGDEDLLLPDEVVRWDFGDDTSYYDAGGIDHEYAADGDYETRLTVAVAGVLYTSTQVVRVGEDPVVEPDADCYDPGGHTVAEVLEYAADHVDEVAGILTRERNGKNRSTLVAALEDLD